MTHTQMFASAFCCGSRKISDFFCCEISHHHSSSSLHQLYLIGSYLKSVMLWLRALAVHVLAFPFFLQFLIGTVNSEMPVPAYAALKEQKHSHSRSFYGEDGLCGWWNDQSYEHPAHLEYPNPLKEAQTNDNVFCWEKFRRAAMRPVCGNPFYSRVKLCDMVHFYDNKEPAPLDGENSDLMLVLVDGCFLCKSGPVESVEISLEHRWSAGTWYTGCSEQMNVAGSIVVKGTTSKDTNLGRMMGQNGPKLLKPLNGKAPGEYAKYADGHSGTFTLSAILFQRVCKGFFRDDSKQEEYQGVQLVVKHNCGGDGKTQTVPLPNFKPMDFKNNMAELRGLMLLLDDAEWHQFSLVDHSFGNKDTLKNQMPTFIRAEDIDQATGNEGCDGQKTCAN